MIKEFCLAWEKNKEKLEEYFRNTPQNEYSDYEDFVKLLFDIVINPEINRKFDTKKEALEDCIDWLNSEYRREN